MSYASALGYRVGGQVRYYDEPLPDQLPTPPWRGASWRQMPVMDFVKDPLAVMEALREAPEPWVILTRRGTPVAAALPNGPMTQRFLQRFGGREQLASHLKEATSLGRRTIDRWLDLVYQEGGAVTSWRKRRLTAARELLRAWSRQSALQQRMAGRTRSITEFRIHSAECLRQVRAGLEYVLLRRDTHVPKGSRTRFVGVIVPLNLARPLLEEIGDLPKVRQAFRRRIHPRGERAKRWTRRLNWWEPLNIKPRHDQLDLPLGIADARTRGKVTPVRAEQLPTLARRVDRSLLGAHACALLSHYLP